jgi:hypothetical protein
MATWASLTPAQQATVQTWQTLQATWASAQAKANDLGQEVDTEYNAVISPLNLGSTEIVPVSSGLAGAQSLTYATITTIESYIQGIATSYNTVNVREVLVLACGAVNL